MAVPNYDGKYKDKLEKIDLYLGDSTEDTRSYAIFAEMHDVKVRVSMDYNGFNPRSETIGLKKLDGLKDNYIVVHSDFSPTNKKSWKRMLYISGLAYRDDGTEIRLCCQEDRGINAKLGANL